MMNDEDLEKQANKILKEIQEKNVSTANTQVSYTFCLCSIAIILFLTFIACRLLYQIFTYQENKCY